VRWLHPRPECPETVNPLLLQVWGPKVKVTNITLELGRCRIRPTESVCLPATSQAPEVGKTSVPHALLSQDTQKVLSFVYTGR
jgi:hypothetical protein